MDKKRKAAVAAALLHHRQMVEKPKKKAISVDPLEPNVWGMLGRLEIMQNAAIWQKRLPVR